MSQTVIMADDLSGAADCASAFVKAGQEALVIIDRQAAQDADTSTVQVISIDADTRRLSAAEAAEIQLQLFHRYRAPGQLLYKKIDSTLRGNFVQELAAIIQHAGLAIVAPAFPQAGRFTRNGHQYMNDVPLEATEVWRSEGISGTAHIPGMLARHGIRTTAITLNEIRQGALQVRAMLEEAARAGIQAVVCDAETDADLQIIAQASVAMSLPRFWVGSAGLANHLPDAAPDSPRGTRPAPVTTDGSILTVVGSLSSVSRAQAEQLFACAHMDRLEVVPGILRQGQAHPQWQEVRDTLTALLRQKRDVLLLIGKEDPVNMGEGLQLCEALAALVAPLAEHIGGVISTGGETARAILCAMGSKGLRLVGEIESGVPFSVAAGIRPIPVITKAGAFGSRDTLLRCYETLRQARAGSDGK
jgi:uncharacterized protein YgbK (DUF1537 family)